MNLRQNNLFIYPMSWTPKMSKHCRPLRCYHYRLRPLRCQQSWKNGQFLQVPGLQLTTTHLNPRYLRLSDRFLRRCLRHRLLYLGTMRSVQIYLGRLGFYIRVFLELKCKWTYGAEISTHRTRNPGYLSSVSNRTDISRWYLPNVVGLGSHISQLFPFTIARSPPRRKD